MQVFWFVCHTERLDLVGFWDVVLTSAPDNLSLVPAACDSPAFASQADRISVTILLFNGTLNGDYSLAQILNSPGRYLCDIIKPHDD